jgi:hypothetical protein
MKYNIIKLHVVEYAMRVVVVDLKAVVKFARAAGDGVCVRKGRG